MALSWTHPLALSGRWQLAGEPDAGNEPDAKGADTPPEVEAAAEHADEGAALAVDNSGQSSRPQLPSPLPADGTVTFSPDDGLALSVLGHTGDPFAAEPPSRTLHGITTGGELCSLMNASLRKTDGELGGYGRHEVRADLLVHGAHIESPTDLPFARAELRLSGLRETLWHPEQGSLGTTPMGDDQHELPVKVPGARLTFRLGWEGLTGTHISHRERVALVEVELDEALDFDEWNARWVLPLVDLVVLASREPSRVEAFTAVLTREAPTLWWKPDAEPTTEEHRVDFLRQQDPLLASARFGYRRVLFYLGELGDRIDEVVTRWFELHRQLGPSARFVFTALTSRMYVEHRLSNLTSAAEGYHRALHDEPPFDPARFDELVAQMLAHCTKAERQHFEMRLQFANSQGQRARLRWQYRRAAEVVPALASHTSRDVKGLIATRNYFTHQDQRTADVLETAALAEALARLAAVLQVNLLFDVGLPPDWIAAATRRSYDGQRTLRAR